MKPILTTLTSLRLAPLATIHAADALAKPASGKPNIIVIITDDHRWTGLGLQGVDAHIRPARRDRSIAKRGSSGPASSPETSNDRHPLSVIPA